MGTFAADLNELLVEIYRNIEILEESELKKSRLNLSISEIHLIELIAKAGGGMTFSEIAERLKVTRPSVSVAVNSLVQKGYCEKRRREDDGRAVAVALTKAGRKVEAFHARCHRSMIREISDDLTENEKAELLRTMSRINTYFRTKI